jgi:peptide/nickel transport system substrate-binding protein
VANPVILHNVGYGCWHPHLKGGVQQQNRIHNRWRLEDVWLDR